MKGLLIKDFRILLQQKRVFLVMVLVGFFLMLTGSNLEFVVAYLTAMTVFLALGTISYDEMENGYAFLFTLPFTRKEYVLGKYVFSTAVAGIVWMLINLLFAVISDGGYEPENLLRAICILAVILVIQAVMLPLQLKYGAEKARTVFFLIAGVIVVAGALFGQFGGLLPDLSQELLTVDAFFHSLGMVGIAGSVLGVSVAVNLISLSIGYKIMENKQL